MRTGKEHESLDVRSWTTAESYERVLTAFLRLPEGGSLHILAEYEPRALRLRLHELHPGRHVWDERALGDGAWEVTVRRTAPNPADAVAHAEALRCSPLFADLDDAAGRRLAEAASERSVTAGERIARQGEVWPWVGIVTEGSVVAEVTTSAGRGYDLYTAYPFDVFNATAAIDRGETPADFVASALGATVVLVPQSLVIELAERDGKFSHGLAAICAQRARLAREMFYARTTKSTIARLAGVLLPNATRESGLAATLAPLSAMTQSELASAIGTVKDVVGRDLATLRDAGAIAMHAGHVVQIDVAKLRPFL